MSEQTARTPVVPESDATPQEAVVPTASVDALLVEDDLVIEEVSIDGMCGVY